MPTRADLEWWQRTVGAAPDGKPGPETFARTITYLRALERDEQPTNPGTPDALAVAEARAARRAAIVAWAEARVGELDPLDVWRVVCPAFAYPAARSTISWCGGFALLAWRSCLPACSAWVWRPSVGFVGPYGVHTVGLPEPGDIRVSKYAENSAAVVWHYSIVVRVNGDGTVDTIDGNTMRAPREGVTRRTVALLRDGVTYYSAAAYL
jgi:hypothetical protein